MGWSETGTGRNPGETLSVPVSVLVTDRTRDPSPGPGDADVGEGFPTESISRGSGPLGVLSWSGRDDTDTGGSRKACGGLSPGGGRGLKGWWALDRGPSGTELPTGTTEFPKVRSGLRLRRWDNRCFP